MRTKATGSSPSKDPNLGLSVPKSFMVCECSTIERPKIGVGHEIEPLHHALLLDLHKTFAKFDSLRGGHNARLAPVVGIALPQREVCPFQPLDIRDMTTDEAVEKVAAALRQMGVEEDGGREE